LTQLGAYKKMKELMTLYYMEAKTATDKPIAWLTSGAPVEFVYAMGAIPVYPENYAAMCAAGHQSVALMEAAEAAGFSPDICAYARTDFGQDLLRGGPAGGLPPPQFLVCSTNICKTVIKWYEVIARTYRVPLFVVDTPFLHAGLTPQLVAYTVSQFHALERFLEAMLQQPFDRERLLEVVRLSRQATGLWKQILDLCARAPAPITSLDAFIHMAPVVTLRGTQACVDYYRLLHDEVAARAANQIGAVPRERYRVLWDNLPIWFRMRPLEQFFSARGCAPVAATYASSWAGLDDKADLAERDAYEALAVSYLNIYINYGFEQRLRYLARLIDDFRLTGFIMHSNRSCKPYSVGMYRLKEELAQLTGKPGVIIEADQNDPRVCSDAQMEARLEAFIESMTALF
jgi:benzoyl-CoA reductase/2-hydroxyglutaryl-CoA dehydratase subunit BcrC/BadD/HgdB